MSNDAFIEQGELPVISQGAREKEQIYLFLSKGTW